MNQSSTYYKCINIYLEDYRINSCRISINHGILPTDSRSCTCNPHGLQTLISVTTHSLTHWTRVLQEDQDLLWHFFIIQPVDKDKLEKFDRLDLKWQPPSWKVSTFPQSLTQMCLFLKRFSWIRIQYTLRTCVRVGSEVWFIANLCCLLWWFCGQVCRWRWVFLCMNIRVPALIQALPQLKVCFYKNTFVCVVVI